MELTLVPTLEVQRDLCRIERDGDRFRAYLAAMVGAGGELKLPLPLFNPMAREHVAVLLDRLIVAGAEATAREALRAAEPRLAAVGDALRVALVVADDAVGGWTDRYLSDEQVRFQGHGIFRRGWAVVALWSGDPPQAASGTHLAAATAAAVWRCAYQRSHGEPKSLRHRLLQEGLAAAFGPATELDWQTGWQTHRSRFGAGSAADLPTPPSRWLPLPAPAAVALLSVADPRTPPGCW